MRGTLVTGVVLSAIAALLVAALRGAIAGGATLLLGIVLSLVVAMLRRSRRDPEELERGRVPEPVDREPGRGPPPPPPPSQGP